MRRCCPGLSRYDKTSSELSAVAHASRLALRKCCNSIRQTERERARERERDQGLCPEEEEIRAHHRGWEYRELPFLGVWKKRKSGKEREREGEGERERERA